MYVNQIMSDPCRGNGRNARFCRSLVSGLAALVGSVAVVGCAGLPGFAISTRQPPAASSAGADDPVVRGIASPWLAGLAAEYTNIERRFEPSIDAELGSMLPTQFSDDRPATRQARIAAEAALLERLQSDPEEIGRLTEQDTVTHAILTSLIKDRQALARFDGDRVPFIADSGCHTEPLYGPARAQIARPEDADAVLRAYADVPRLFDVCIDNMRRGIDEGVVAYRDVVANVLAQVEDLADDEVGASPLLAPFVRRVASLDDQTRAALASRGIRAVEAVQGEYRRLADFLKTEYIPNARVTPGLLAVPEGKDWYAALVRYHTGDPNADALSIHALGQSEVARIRALMHEVIVEAGFGGSFAEFLEFLRTDPQFYAKTPQELLDVAARHAKRIDAGLPQLFGKMPRLPFTIEAVPDAIAPGYTTARYLPGDPDKGRAGAYWVNTYRLDQRPLFEMPALTAHEANPGHHFQIALAQELQDQPWIRRQFGPTVFVEGWGLYAETLGEDLSIYTTPYERFGRLSYEMWRACRLVADTGLHALGWSREQAEACFFENSALAPLNIHSEVTRYIGWPGQALAYKVGELEIRRLRKEASDALGDHFDLRAFHDVLLAQGAVPMDVLRVRMQKWVAGHVKS